MKKRLFKKLVTLAMVLVVMAPVFVFAALPAMAQVQPFGGYQGTVESNLGLGNRDPREIAASVINVLMGFLGIIAVIIILIGGFQWMTAAGNEDKVSGAKKMMTAGVIGLVIVLAAWGITVFVLNALLNATGSTTVI